MVNFHTFPVNRQLFQVLVRCWAATKVCDLIHGICWVHRETSLTVHVQQSSRHRLLIKERFTLGIKVPSARQCRETCRWKWGTKSRDYAENCKETTAMNSFFPAEGSHTQNDVADQQRLQISELQLDKFTTPSTFSCWKIRFKTEEVLVLVLPRRLCYGSKKWRQSIRWMILNHRDQCKVILVSQILRCWMRGLRLLWTRSSRIPSSREKVSLEEQKAQK